MKECPFCKTQFENDIGEECMSCHTRIFVCEECGELLFEKESRCLRCHPLEEAPETESAEDAEEIPAEKYHYTWINPETVLLATVLLTIAYLIFFSFLDAQFFYDAFGAAVVFGVALSGAGLYFYRFHEKFPLRFKLGKTGEYTGLRPITVRVFSVILAVMGVLLLACALYFNLTGKYLVEPLINRPHKEVVRYRETPPPRRTLPTPDSSMYPEWSR